MKRRLPFTGLAFAGLLATGLAVPPGAWAGTTAAPARAEFTGRMVLTLSRPIQFGRAFDIYLLSNTGALHRITSDGGSFDPRFSPDGSMVAYDSNRSGASQIYLYDVATGATTQVTHRFDNDSPTWSPDGTSLYFSSDRAGHNHDDVYEITALPAVGHAARILSSPQFELTSDATVIRSGAGLVYELYPEDEGSVVISRIYVSRADGSHAVDIGDGDNARVRPGGGSVLFNTDEGDGTAPVNIATLKLDGSARNTLTHNAGGGPQASGASWSPDGQQIAYSQDGVLKIITASGASVRTLPTRLPVVETDWSL